MANSKYHEIYLKEFVYGNKNSQGNEAGKEDENKSENGDSFINLEPIMKRRSRFATIQPDQQLRTQLSGTNHLNTMVDGYSFNRRNSNQPLCHLVRVKLIQTKKPDIPESSPRSINTLTDIEPKDSTKHKNNNDYLDVKTRDYSELNKRNGNENSTMNRSSSLRDDRKGESVQMNAVSSNVEKSKMTESKNTNHSNSKEFNSVQTRHSKGDSKREN